MIHIEFANGHEPDDLLPAILVGYLADPTGLRRLHADPSIPNWIVHLEHQAGGHACSQYNPVGVFLRLEDNRACLLNYPSPFLQALRAMAADPNWDVIERDFPFLIPITLASGHKYLDSDIAALNHLVQVHTTLPRPVSGVESLVRLDSENPSRDFNEWRIIELDPDCPYGIEGSIARPLDATVSHSLAAVGDLVCQRILMAFLVWENSD